jgi:hypothetical protein
VRNSKLRECLYQCRLFVCIARITSLTHARILHLLFFSWGFHLLQPRFYAALVLQLARTPKSFSSSATHLVHTNSPTEALFHTHLTNELHPFLADSFDPSQSCRQQQLLKVSFLTRALHELFLLLGFSLSPKQQSTHQCHCSLLFQDKPCEYS